MTNLSITLLTHVTIFGLVRNEVPPLDNITYAGRYILVYILASLIPLFQGDHNDEEADKRWIAFSLALTIMVIPILIFVFIIVKTRLKW